ncbi:hypothetical protein NFI96_018617, partial [Prochilodus magdalenae]
IVAYSRVLKQVPPIIRIFKAWTEEADLIFQDCFASTSWEVFRDGSMQEDGTVDLEKYATGVTSYISTCAGNIKCIRTYLNQKPWISCEVRSMLHARSTAFVSGNLNVNKKASDTTIIKFADDTTVMGLITGSDETAYRMEVVSDQILNVDKTKEMIVDYRRSAEPHTPLLIHQRAVER